MSSRGLRNCWVGAIERVDTPKFARGGDIDPSCKMRLGMCRAAIAAAAAVFSGKLRFAVALEMSDN